MCVVCVVCVVCDVCEYVRVERGSLSLKISVDRKVTVAGETVTGGVLPGVRCTAIDAASMR